jgi:hypothetical protein
MAIQKTLFLLAISAFIGFNPFFSLAKERSVSLNVWPFFQYTFDPREGVREIDGLGPLFLWKGGPQRVEWGIRPFLYWTEDEAESLQRLEFIYPFGKYQAEKDRKKGYLVPLSRYKEEEFDGKKRWGFEFLFFFLGETEKGEDYFGLFPIYGTLLDRFAKDEIRFYLWPLYSESTREGAVTTNLLWPFFSFTEGEKKRGYRFWPFYGLKEEVGVSRAEFVLWPVFLRQTKGMDTDDPVEEHMVFPLFVSKESKHFESRFLLWPFLHHARDRLTGFEQWDLPWPIFQSLKGENLEGIRIFPLFGYKEKEGAERLFILYPIYQVKKDRMGDVQEKTVRILLLTRIQTGEDEQGLKKERSVRVWPFFDYEKESTGHTTFSAFYLFPFKDQGFERNLFPLFRIFRWERDLQGGLSVNFLWGLYKKVKKEERESWEVAHLISWEKEDGLKTVSFLHGLIRYQSNDRAAELNFLYVPFGLRWSLRERGDLEIDEAMTSLGRSTFEQRREGR